MHIDTKKRQLCQAGGPRKPDLYHLRGITGVAPGGPAGHALKASLQLFPWIISLIVVYFTQVQPGLNIFYLEFH